MIDDKKDKVKKRKASVESTFNLESKLLGEGYNFVIGIDEAGRGPLAGPVVACAVVLRSLSLEKGALERDLKIPLNPPFEKGEKKKNWDLIRDSKTLSHEQRENIFDFIHENFHVGVGICDHETIDRINILEATYLAAKKAVSDLMKNLKGSDPLGLFWSRGVGSLKTIILFDGNKAIPNLSMEQRVVVNGDKIVKSISAASIVAKVTRDRIMLEMHQKYPQYFFDKHKGYGTKLHMETLQKHGPCPIHRKTFAPVKELAKNKK